MTKEEKCETYFDIANKVGLTGRTAERYILYMTKRWGDKEDEKTKCLVDYASLWAMRFANGIEYLASDFYGQAVLKEIDNG